MTQILTQTQEELFTRGAINRWNILLKEDFPSQEEDRQDSRGIHVGVLWGRRVLLHWEGN